MSGIVGRGSGMPVGVPDFRPLNPYGRAMPRPTRPYRQLRPALYQVELDLRGGGTKRLGPLWEMEESAGELSEKLNGAIARGLGILEGWGRTRVVLAKPAERHDTRTIRELLLKGQ